MKLNPKLAVTACLFALLAAPVAVFADGHDARDKGDKHKKPYAVPEPSTLIMTLAGLGIGIGLVVAGVRRSRRSTIAA